MIRTLMLSLIASGVSACEQGLFASRPPSPSTEQMMSSPTDISISRVTLLAREEKQLPPGAAPDQNRDIGFASVFLRLKNPTEANAKLIIKKIEIRHAFNGQIQMAQLSPQEILLRPLENAETVFQLTNKTGFSRHNRVKAILTIQTGDTEAVIETNPVEIERL